MQSPDPKPNKKQERLLRDRNLYVIFSITLMAVLGVASIAPAMPKMARALQVTNEQIGLLITFFTLPGIFLTPLLGVIADRFGRKMILIPSLFLFGLAGTACAWTTNFSWLLVMRFLQGVGGASLGALNVTLIGDLYDGNRRATAMGYNGSVLSVGTASYPAIGGALAAIGWFYPFYLFLLAIPVGLFVLYGLDNPEPGNGEKLKHYFSNIWGSLKSRKVIGLFAANFFTFIMLYGGYLTYFPILLDSSFNMSSTLIGLCISGASVMTALSSSQLGKLTARFSERSLIIAAAVMYAIVFASIPFITNPWLLAMPILIYGFAQGINIPSVLNLLTHQAPAEYRAAFLSVNWTVLRSGQTLGPVLLGMTYVLFGLTITFLITAGISLLLLTIALLFIRMD